MAFFTLKNWGVSQRRLKGHRVTNRKNKRTKKVLGHKKRSNISRITQDLFQFSSLALSLVKSNRHYTRYLKTGKVLTAILNKSLKKAANMGRNFLTNFLP